MVMWVGNKKNTSKTSVDTRSFERQLQTKGKNGVKNCSSIKELQNNLAVYVHFAQQKVNYGEIDDKKEELENNLEMVDK